MLNQLLRELLKRKNTNIQHYYLDPSWDEIKGKKKKKIPREMRLRKKKNMAKYREKLKPGREIEVRKSLTQIYLLLLLLLFVVKSEAKRWANKIKEHTPKKKKKKIPREMRLRKTISKIWPNIERNWSQKELTWNLFDVVIVVCSEI